MACRKFLAVGMLTACALPAVADDIDGKWNASVESDFGSFSMTFEFMAEGDELELTSTIDATPSGGPADQQTMTATRAE